LIETKSFGGLASCALAAVQRPLLQALMKAFSVTRGPGELPPHPAISVATTATAQTVAAARAPTR
jgi:hypothetical protein